VSHEVRSELRLQPYNDDDDGQSQGAVESRLMLALDTIRLAKRSSLGLDRRCWRGLFLARWWHGHAAFSDVI
jgi:hypothetical protein